MFAYCINNPISYSDPTRELGVLFWSFVAVVAISATSNAITIWMNGASTEDCIYAAIAGAAGGAAGFGVAMLLGFTPQGNVVGRATATLVCDAGTAILTQEELTASDCVSIGVDVVLDAAYSAVGYYYTAPITNDLVQNTVNVVFDTVVDIGETVLFYNNTSNMHSVTGINGNTEGLGGSSNYVACAF